MSLRQNLSQVHQRIVSVLINNNKVIIRYWSLEHMTYLILYIRTDEIVS